MVAVLGVAALGLFLARSTATVVRPWAGAHYLRLPAALLSRAAARTSQGVAFFVRSVLAMDHEVVADASRVVGSALLFVGQGVQRAENAVHHGALRRVLDHSTVLLLARVGLDDPRIADRARLGIVLGMVAILALVVLSSVLLGR
jgi:hypothetical protein